MPKLILLFKFFSRREFLVFGAAFAIFIVALSFFTVKFIDFWHFAMEGQRRFNAILYCCRIQCGHSARMTDTNGTNRSIGRGIFSRIRTSTKHLGQCFELYMDLKPNDSSKEV